MVPLTERRGRGGRRRQHLQARTSSRLLAPCDRLGMSEHCSCSAWCGDLLSLGYVCLPGWPLFTRAEHTCVWPLCRDTTLKLNRKIEDLEDVRGIMAVLKEVREKESEIDNLIGPIEEMYALLLRYEVRFP